MNNNGFLIPANTKKGNLIMNIFRGIDLIIFGIGIVISFLALILVGSSEVTYVLLACLPALITGFLVIPIPNYHNVLVALQCIYEYYTERQKYEWKGWCIYEEDLFDESKSKNKI